MSSDKNTKKNTKKKNKQNIDNHINIDNLQASIVNNKIRFNIDDISQQVPILINRKNAIDYSSLITLLVNEVQLLKKTINSNITTQCHYKLNTDIIPSANTPPLNPVSYTPAQICTAYGINKIILPTNPVTIAVVIAFHYPNLIDDCNVYASKYLSWFKSPTLTPLPITQYIMPGGGASNDGWACEECLDVQMILSINPNAKILVVEAVSNSYADLFNAVTYANNQKVDIISMSWGSNEFNGQSAYDNYFNNTSICYCVSSGDNVNPSYPSTSPNVLSVGGSTLILNNNNSRNNESTWYYSNPLEGGGHGKSSYSPLPKYQKNVYGISGNTRVTPDISAIANPYYGFIVYYNGSFLTIGGTSVACPFMAGFLSIVASNRKKNNKSNLTTVYKNNASNNSLQQMLYNIIYNYKGGNLSNYCLGCIYDVNTGINGRDRAVNGYDNTTGVGTPICDILYSKLSSI